MAEKERSAAAARGDKVPSTKQEVGKKRRREEEHEDEDDDDGPSARSPKVLTTKGFSFPENLQILMR